MTDKEIEGIKSKIKKYRDALAADKKQWGGYYHDGGGIRYIIPEQFIKLKDYKGGSKYLRWFEKNFPGDSCYPVFFFEWTYILFMCGRLKEAEQKARLTFFSDSHLFDTFLKKEGAQPGKQKNSAYLPYRSQDENFIGFADWIGAILEKKISWNKSD